MEDFEWKERTDDGPFIYRACHHATKWKLERMPKVGRAQHDFVDWEEVPFTREHWVTLRDLLERRYRRKRCPWEWVAAIDRVLNNEEGAEEALTKDYID